MTRNSTFTLTTTQLPETAGIDVFTLLIDRIPDDNIEEGDPAAKIANPNDFDWERRSRHGFNARSAA